MRRQRLVRLARAFSYICGVARMSSFFFFNDTATTEIYTLSLHDALPICDDLREHVIGLIRPLLRLEQILEIAIGHTRRCRSEEHTSELQSRQYLVCRLLLEKKKINFRRTLLNTM